MPRRIRRACLGVLLATADGVARAVARTRPYAVLKLALGGDLSEDPRERRLLGLLHRGADDYLGVLSLLRWARDDEQLRGVVLSLDRLAIGWARVQGLHRALQQLRAAGKRVWVFIPQGGIREYLLATAADQICMPPAGVLEVAGLSAETTFFLGALEKLGIEADIIQVGQYKSAGEPFTRREMSPPHREMIEALVDDLYGQVCDSVAAGRRLDPAAAQTLLGRGPFVAKEALREGLIDQIAYLDQITDAARHTHGGTVVDRAEYQRRHRRRVWRRTLQSPWGSIGLLHLTGAIKSGESISGPDGAIAAGATTVTAQLERLRDNQDVAAIVIRVASPGGSGVASDLIWHAVGLARAKKPVVISLGDVAASGGYYVAAAGAPVIAEPGTITGSIGVVAGKATLHDFYAKLGITKDIISRGDHARLYTDYAPLGPGERDRLTMQARSFYEDFVSKVAEGRNLSPDAVAAVAEGRVWTGRQALERNLVDQLGGLEEAVQTAKVLAGIPAEAFVAIERVPRPRRLLRLPFTLFPAETRLFTLAPWLFFSRRERVWAALPFHLHFY